MAVLRAVLGFAFLALFVAFMWGVKLGLTFMGRDFALGVAAGIIGLLGLLILHRRVTGRDIFTE